MIVIILNAIVILKNVINAATPVTQLYPDMAWLIPWNKNLGEEKLKNRAFAKKGYPWFFLQSGE